MGDLVKHYHSLNDNTIVQILLNRVMDDLAEKHHGINDNGICDYLWLVSKKNVQHKIITIGKAKIT